MTVREKYEDAKKQIALRSTSAERISFMRAFLALHGDELSEEQTKDWKNELALFEEQGAQHEKA